MAFAKLPDIIEIATKMIKYIIKAVIDECPDEIAFFEKAFEPGLKDKLQHVVDSDFVVLDYSKAIDILKESKVEFAYPVEWGLDLQSEHERYITEKVFNRPVFVINYPKKIQAMVERGMNLDDYKGYMDLRKYGTVPHSGFGLGLERILMYVTGIGNIRDVQLYSRTAGDLMA